MLPTLFKAVTGAVGAGPNGVLADSKGAMLTVIGVGIIENDLHDDSAESVAEWPPRFQGRHGNGVNPPGRWRRT